MSTEQHYVSLPIAKSYFHSGTLKGFRLLKAAISLLHNGAASEAWHIILITEKDTKGKKSVEDLEKEIDSWYDE